MTVKNRRVNVKGLFIDHKAFNITALLLRACFSRYLNAEFLEQNMLIERNFVPKMPNSYYVLKL